MNPDTQGKNFYIPYFAQSGLLDVVEFQLFIDYNIDKQVVYCRC